MTMTDGELLAKMGTDAYLWTQEFMRLHGDSLPDEGNMIGWFANAIEAGRAAPEPPPAMDQGQRVLNDIRAERDAQDEKWGEQNHPDFDQVLLTREGGCTPERMAEEYEVPTETRGRNLCELAFSRGEGTWAHIAVEELAEAIGTCNEPPERLREELIQTAAVLVAWVEAIDRREAP